MTGRDHYVKLNTELLKEDYDEYKKVFKPRWKLANDILYKMCKDNMLHVDDDVIASKVFLIGRSYAAAVERQHKGELKGDIYYYEKVVPEIKALDIAGGLDKCIAEINGKSGFEDSLETIFKVHDALSHFGRICESGEEPDDRRPSFAAKYLHFHCPDKVFIFDDRARRAIERFMVSGKYKLHDEFDNREYQVFVYKAVAVLEKLREFDAGCRLPRDLDDFLMWVEENK